VGRDFWILNLPFPLVSLVAPDDFPGVVPLMISGSAIFPVMLVIADKMGIDPLVLQNLRHGIVKGFNGPPASMEEIIPAGMEFPPGRHAGEASCIAIIKNNRFFRKPAEIRGFSPIAAISGQQVPVKGIKHQHNRFHGQLPFTCLLYWADNII
jgi:hypothetical protein